MLTITPSVLSPKMRVLLSSSSGKLLAILIRLRVHVVSGLAHDSSVDPMARRTVVRLSLGKLLVNLLQVVKRTNTPLVP